MKPSSPRSFMIWRKCLKIVFSSWIITIILHQCNNHWLVTECNQYCKSFENDEHLPVSLHLRAQIRKCTHLGAQKAMRTEEQKCSAAQKKYGNKLLQKTMVGELSIIGAQWQEVTCRLQQKPEWNHHAMTLGVSQNAGVKKTANTLTELIENTFLPSSAKYHRLSLMVLQNNLGSHAFSHSVTMVS